MLDYRKMFFKSMTLKEINTRPLGLNISQFIHHEVSKMDIFFYYWEHTWHRVDIQ